MNWEGVEKVKKQYPNVYVSFSEEGIPKNIKFWLPAQIIDNIRKLLLK